jgi:general secretion pathway protein G
MRIERTMRAVRRSAFTLMEMLAVVAIIVVLAGVGGVVYMRYVDDAKIDSARAQSKMLAEQAKMFNLRNQRYPESLQELMTPPDGGKSYLEDSSYLLDPWQQPYQYQAIGTHNLTGAPEVWSNGPPGENRQIGSWER